MYFASRRIDEWQLEKDIESCRLASRFVASTGRLSKNDLENRTAARVEGSRIC